MAFTWRICHLCLFNVLLLCVVVYDTESTPLCSRFDESSSSKDSDQIYFPDRAGYRTMEINGTVITCNSDGMIISTAPSNKTQSSGIDDEQHTDRIQKGENQKPPETVKELKSRSFVADLSQCSENNQSFCIKNINYPIDYIRKLAQKFSREYTDVFGSDLTTNEVSFRIDGMDDDEHLCESYEKVIYPTVGKTQDGQELFIFNTDTHKQGVRVSICRSKGQPCRMTDSFPNGFKTECKQQMVYRELLSLSPEGQPVKDHFEFPACCSCVLHRV